MPQQDNKPSDNLTPQQKGTGGKLVAITGGIAGAALLSLIPFMESGRKVETQVTSDGKSVIVTNVTPIKYTKPYLDIAGVATACDGITRGVKLGQNYSTEQCQAMLELELTAAAQQAMRCTPLDPKTQWPQIVMATDFTYNLGSGAWCGSTAARYIKQNNWKMVCANLPAWNKARVNGVLVPVAGLTRRRKIEREYCETNVISGKTEANLSQRLKGL